MDKSAPLGIRLFGHFCRRPVTATARLKGYQYFTLALTFLIYCSYHISRKPISVVKDALRPDCNKTEEEGKNCTPGWAPFDGENGSYYFSYLDSGYLLAYAIGMFATGHIAERMNLRVFLVIGMFLTGVTTVMFGLGRYFNIHVLWYYLLVQTVSGLFQSTGWPPVVTVVANWFGKGRRGLIMGVWNSHTSLGNIIGSVVAAAFVDSDWGLSFILPGLIITIVGFGLVLPLLIPHPHHIGLDIDTTLYTSRSLRRTDSGIVNDEMADDYEPLVNSSDDDTNASSTIEEPEAISFCRALRIPGVVEYSVCLFFSKLVSYTFLFWLPNYIRNTTPHSTSVSALLSTLFDFGGIGGAILAGVVSDQTGGAALTCFIMLLFSCPSLFLYYIFGSRSMASSCILLLICGALVNGPYALITTAISADLGCHHSLRGNAKALSTVSAIVDGTGSLGAALGPALTGILSKNRDWSPMFYMLIASEVIAMLLLVRLCIKEIHNFTVNRQASLIESNTRSI